MFQNMRAYQQAANKPCPNINTELLLVSRLGCTMWIVLCSQVVVPKIYVWCLYPTGLIWKQQLLPY
jgi:hypothetical protein